MFAFHVDKLMFGCYIVFIQTRIHVRFLSDIGGIYMRTTTVNNFTVLEGGLSVNEILRKSRAAAARRRRIRKICTISFIVMLIAILTIIVLSI